MVVGTAIQKDLFKISSCNNRRPCYLTESWIRREVKDIVSGVSSYQTGLRPYRLGSLDEVYPYHKHDYFLDWNNFSRQLCPERTGAPILRLTLTVKQSASQFITDKHFSFNRGEQSWLFVRKIVEEYFQSFLRFVRKQYTPTIDAVSLYQLRREPYSAQPLGTVIAHDIMECLIQILGMINLGYKSQADIYKDLLRVMLNLYHPLGILEDNQTLLSLSRQRGE